MNRLDCVYFTSLGNPIIDIAMGQGLPLFLGINKEMSPYYIGTREKIITSYRNKDILTIGEAEQVRALMNVPVLGGVLKYDFETFIPIASSVDENEYESSRAKWKATIKLKRIGEEHLDILTNDLEMLGEGVFTEKVHLLEYPGYISDEILFRLQKGACKKRMNGHITTFSNRF